MSDVSDIPEWDLLVVGAGPAGLAATAEAQARGLRVGVIDEQGRAGGQILRQPPRQFEVERWLPGRAYHALKKLLADAERLSEVSWLLRVGVVGIFPAEPGRRGYGFHVIVADSAGTHTLRARRVLLATGCHELFPALPGWTLPGVMTAGAIQAFLKSQHYLIGNDIFFSGTHPLQVLVADQVLRAGGRVAGVAFAQPASSVMALLRHPAIFARHALRFATVGAALARLRKAGVPVLFGHVTTSVEGHDRVTAVQVTPWNAADGFTKQRVVRVECDALGLCFGFVPQSELARQLGARAHWQPRVGGWAVHHDEWMRSSIEGLYVAGEITGIGGAEIARSEGSLAAQGILLDAGRVTHAQARAAARPLERKLRSLRKFARLLDELASPAEVLPQLVTPETIVCRCENITLGDLSRALEANRDISTPRAAKLLTRAGMGWCQGRGCEHVIMRLTRVGYADPPAESCGFTARFPARPVRIGDLK